MSQTTPVEVSRYSSLEGVHSAVDVFIYAYISIITPGASALARPIRGIRATGAGTITVTTFAGNSRSLTFKDGETRMVGATHVTAASGPTIIEGLV